MSLDKPNIATALSERFPNAIKWQNLKADHKKIKSGWRKGTPSSICSLVVFNSVFWLVSGALLFRPYGENLSVIFIQMFLGVSIGLMGGVVTLVSLFDRVQTSKLSALSQRAKSTEGKQWAKEYVRQTRALSRIKQWLPSLSLNGLQSLRQENLSEHVKSLVEDEIKERSPTSDEAAPSALSQHPGLCIGNALKI